VHSGLGSRDSSKTVFKLIANGRLKARKACQLSLALYKACCRNERSTSRELFGIKTDVVAQDGIDARLEDPFVPEKPSDLPVKESYAWPARSSIETTSTLFDSLQKTYRLQLIYQVNFKEI
jgi:hypothetical protein